MINTQIETISKKDAAKILKGNTNNRSIRRDHVAALARDMVEGRWKFNGDAIRIATDGTLLDGQHRLHAVYYADVDIEVVVIRGLEKDTMQTVDKGRARTVGDDFSINGVANANHVAATLRAMASVATGNENLVLSASEVSQMLEDHPLVKDGIMKSTIPGLGALRTAMSVVRTIGYEMGENVKVDRFIEVLSTGVPTPELGMDDPAYRFRERFLRETLRGNTIHRKTVFRGMVHAWNMFLKGASLKKFVIPAEMPKINNWSEGNSGTLPVRHFLSDEDIGIKTPKEVPKVPRALDSAPELSRSPELALGV